MPDRIFLQIINMSFTASYVIVLVAAVRLFLVKVPKIFSYALWSAVLFRLVCPFSFSSELSVFSLSGRSMEQIRPFPDVFTTMPAVLLPQDAAAGAGINTGIAPIAPIASMAPAAPAGEILPLAISSIFTLLWLAGIIALLIYSVVSFLRLKKRLKDAVHERDNIYISKNLISPFVMGLFRPKIYLPLNLSEEEKIYILLHEQTHIRRLDHVVRMISFFVLCLHWFNPFVWGAFFLSSRDMEMSCDEVVIRKLGSDVKKNYSLSLLTLAANRRMVGGTPLAFGESDTKSRIKNVLSYKKPAFCLVLVSVAAVAAVGISLMANPKEKSDSYLSSSAGDVLKQYTLALSASDITGIRQLMPALNPPAKDVTDVWKQIKISDVTLLNEDIRDNKAVFELSVAVEAAPDGFGMWTPGILPLYLYVEKSDSGWYVESYSAGGRTGDDLEEWWSQPNLLDGSAAFDLKPMVMPEGRGNSDTEKEEPADAAAAIKSSYYEGQSSKAYNMLQKSVFKNWVEYNNDGTLNADLVNPAWNFNSFAKYESLDENRKPVSTEDLYYCTFSDDNGRCGYVVVSYHGEYLSKIDRMETPYLYDLQANMEDITEQLGKTELDLSSAAASRVQILDTDKNTTGEGIRFTDSSGREFVYYFNNPDAV